MRRRKAKRRARSRTAFRNRYNWPVILWGVKWVTRAELVEMYA